MPELPKMTKNDLDNYLLYLERAKLKPAWGECREQNIKLLNQYAWEAIKRYYSQL